MILLDTNVVSALMAAERDEKVDRWLDTMDAELFWLPALVVCEVKFGVDLSDDGRRKRELERVFNVLIGEVFKDRIADFDVRAAVATAALSAERKRRGRPVGATDTYIAGIAISRNATLATRNMTHFSDLPVPVVNPWS